MNGDTITDLGFPDCPVCDGVADFIGSLGGRDNYRCRDCGMDFSCARPEGGEEPFPEDLEDES